MRNRRPWQPLLLWIIFVPLAWCRIGPQGPPPYQSGENTRPLGPSSHILGELVIPAGPAGNSLESCRYPCQESRTTAQSSLESSSSIDVLLRNLLTSRISFASRLRVRDQYCTTRYPSVKKHL